MNLDKFYGFASEGLGSDDSDTESRENGVNLPPTEFSSALRKIKETEEAKAEAKAKEAKAEEAKAKKAEAKKAETKDGEAKEAEAEAKEGGAKASCNTCLNCGAVLPFIEECSECGP
jgi:hypothetical protein